MVPEVRKRIEAELKAYRAWAAGRNLSRKARLVRYADCVEPPLAFDIRLAEVEGQIEGLVAEGFRVGWAEHRGRVYLRVWERPGPEPDWERVFAEAPGTDPCDPSGA